MKDIFLILVISYLVLGCSVKREKGTEHKEKSDADSTTTLVQFPDMPIKLYVGFQAGGGTDMIARAAAAFVPKCLGQPVTVVNMPGASGTLAANKIASAKPNGYNLLVAGGSETVSVPHYKRLPYNPLKDFSPIIRLTIEKIVLTVNSNASYKTLDEFISAAKKHPNKLKYSTSGEYSIFHSTALAFSKEANIKMRHIPYNGGAPSIAALMGNHVDLAFSSPVSVSSLVKSGQLICLAQSSNNKRAPFLSNCPTFEELGYNINIVNQKGIVAPANTPKVRIKLLHNCFSKALQKPEFIDRAKNSKLEIAYLDPKGFQASLQSVYDEIGNMLKQDN